jgi:hypothetical protein
MPKVAKSRVIASAPVAWNIIGEIDKPKKRRTLNVQRPTFNGREGRLRESSRYYHTRKEIRNRFARRTVISF